MIRLFKYHLNRATPTDAAYDVIVAVATNNGIDIESATKAAASDPEIKQALYDSAVANRMIKP